MLTRERVPMTYSRAELLSDAAVHVTGVVAALVARAGAHHPGGGLGRRRPTMLAAAVYGGSVLACSSARRPTT